MAWRIEFTTKAAKQFSKLDRQAQQEISRYLDRLLEGDDPCRFGKGLVGDFSGFWRYRIGKYRLVCDIRKEVLLIEIILVGQA